MPSIEIIKREEIVNDVKGEPKWDINVRTVGLTTACLKSLSTKELLALRDELNRLNID